MELDLQSEKAYWLGHYEPVVQELIRTHVRPGELVYDVGGHRGFFSLCAARRGASVVVFEASPENAARIQRNIDLNRFPVTLVEAAVWDSDQGVSIVEGESSSEWRVVEGGTLPTVTLDDVAGDGPFPSFIKIDVEGAELRVLAGARRVIERQRPVIVCEAHSDEAVGAIKELLAGYVVSSVGHPWRLVAIPSVAE